MAQLVACTHGVREVAGSSPAIPTKSTYETIFMKHTPKNRSKKLALLKQRLAAAKTKLYIAKVYKQI